MSSRRLRPLSPSSALLNPLLTSDQILLELTDSLFDEFDTNHLGDGIGTLGQSMMGGDQTMAGIARELETGEYNLDLLSSRQYSEHGSVDPSLDGGYYSRGESIGMEGVDQLGGAVIDSAPAVKKRKLKSAVPRTSKACLNCKKSKAKCEQTGENPPCVRCEAADLDCVFERRADYVLNPNDLAWQRGIDTRLAILSSKVDSIIAALGVHGIPVASNVSHLTQSPPLPLPLADVVSSLRSGKGSRPRKPRISKANAGGGTPGQDAASTSISEELLNGSPSAASMILQAEPVDWSLSLDQPMENSAESSAMIALMNTSLPLLEEVVETLSKGVGGAG